MNKFEEKKKKYLNRKILVSSNDSQIKKWDNKLCTVIGVDEKRFKDNEPYIEASPVDNKLDNVSLYESEVFFPTNKIKFYNPTEDKWS